MKKRSSVKNLNPFFVDFIFVTVILIASVTTLFIACSKSVMENNRVHHLSFPISFNQEGCPYPPGCDNRLNEIAFSQYHAFDTSANFKADGEKITIATKNISLYRNIGRFRFANNRLIPEQKR